MPETHDTAESPEDGSSDGGVPPVAVTVADYLKRGDDLFERRDFTRAEAAYTEALKLAPDTPEIYQKRGAARAALSRHEAAADDYLEAARRYGAEAPPSLPEGERLGRLERRAEALEGAGESLYSLRRFAEAEGRYRESAKSLGELVAHYKSTTDGVSYAKFKARAGDQYNNVGYALFALRRYEEAQQAFKEAIDLAIKYPYARHSLASLYWRQGRYEEARCWWHDARDYYNQTTEEAAGSKWTGHFISFGTLLHEVYGDLEAAREAYEEGLALNPHSTSISAGLMNLCLERAECGEGRAAHYQEARRMYESAKAELERGRRANPDDLETLLALGELHLNWGEADEAAEECLEAARQKDLALSAGDGYTPTGKPSAGLGVVRMRRKEYAQAINCFRRALRDEYDDLTLKSNLAEAYLRVKQLDDAEREYRDILRRAPGHVESLIGLGEVCLARGEADADAYGEAVALFGRAAAAADSGGGSKRLRDRERAKVLYGKAYAGVQLFEKGRLRRDPAALRAALADLRQCCRADPDHFAARRALDKIEQTLQPRSPQRLLEKYGPFVIVILSAAVFLMAQLSFFFGRVQLPLVGALEGEGKFDADRYIFVTFAALLLMIAGLYLPQVLKLRLGALELQKEKSEIDQIAALGTLGMSKGT